MENIVSSVLASMAAKKQPCTAIDPSSCHENELKSIKSRRVTKRQEKKPKKTRLDQHCSELIRRYQQLGWSLRDLSEWLEFTAKIKISYSTIRRYLMKQPEMKFNSYFAVNPASKNGVDHG